MIDYFKNIDSRTYQYISKKFQNSLLDKTMPIITATANGGMIWIVVSVCLLITKEYRINGIMVISALVLSTILGEGIIKNLIKRKRPFTDSQGNKLLISRPITYSFPSGHTSSSFAAVGILITTCNSLSVFFLIWAILVGFSRIYLKVHYFSDVFIGMILGIMCSGIIFNIFKLVI